MMNEPDDGNQKLRARKTRHDRYACTQSEPPPPAGWAVLLAAPTETGLWNKIGSGSRGPIFLLLLYTASGYWRRER